MTCTLENRFKKPQTAWPVKQQNIDANNRITEDKERTCKMFPRGFRNTTPWTNNINSDTSVFAPKVKGVRRSRAPEIDYRKFTINDTLICEDSNILSLTIFLYSVKQNNNSMLYIKIKV